MKSIIRIIYRNMLLNSLIILLLITPLIKCCSRIPEDKVADKSPSDGRYRISIYGNPQFYQPYQKYNITLMGAQAIPPQTFIGFMLAVELDNQDFMDPTDTRSSGAFDLGDSNHEIKFSEKCRNLITHTNTLAKSKIQVVWTAPPPGSGCINFRATVIQHRDVWFMDDGFLTKSLCEEQQDDIDNQPVTLEQCCACDEAKYQLTFESKWSRHTHPKDFPADNWNTKFSDIIGASHNTNYMFWKYGEVASDGVRNIAEHGVTDTLENELLDELDNIRTIIKAKGITFPNLNGQTNAVFRVDAKHHVISIMSMIQPSPDWIVGVSSLELCLPNCTWVEEKVQNLYPWDIGTDKGPSYDSPDQPQIPPDVIRRIKSNYPNDPRSPFYDPRGVPMKPIARLYVTRVRLYEKPCDNSDDRSSDECATHPWTKWTECDSKCGRGKKIRTTKYKNEEIANRFGCDKKLFEEQMCYGDNCRKQESKMSINAPSYGGKNRKFFETDDDDSPECALSDWSEFSECTAKCGKGTQTKSRSYLNPNAKRKCEKVRIEELEITEPCEGTECGGNFDDRQDEINSREAPSSFENNAGNNNYDSTYENNKFKNKPRNRENSYRGRKKQQEDDSNENKSIYDSNRNYNYDGNRNNNYDGNRNNNYDGNRNNNYDGNRNYNYNQNGGCAVDWTEWTECSSSCGEGYKFASRFPIDPRNCQNQDVEIQINETCYGTKCVDQKSRKNDRQKTAKRHCAASDWSEWSPCNVTCDEGFKFRQRNVWITDKNYPADSCESEKTEEAKCFVNCEVENKFCYEQPSPKPCREELVSYWFYMSEKKTCGLFFTANCVNEFFLNKFASREACLETCNRIPVDENKNRIPSEDLRLEKIDCKVKWVPSECLAPCGKKGYRKLQMKILQQPKYGGKLCPKESVRYEECQAKCKTVMNPNGRFK